ncbi:MAG: hypothetical protein J6R91_02110 [Bacteroidaceae bacterium]|nr:hypothetical protein [Bacteroidaceae bacterium]
MKKLLPLLLLFVACSENDDVQEPSVDNPETPVATSIVVVNQGSYYDGIDGSLSLIDVVSGTVQNNVFAAANNQVSLGATPQAATQADGKIYVPVFESNVVWVMDAKTLKAEHMLMVNAPQSVSVEAGKIFVCGNDGYVNVYDVDTYESLKRIEVGPNPCNLVVVGDALYVSISDGYNYPTYENGFRLATINTKTLEKANDIDVEINPGQIAVSQQGDLYVVCRGDYATISSKVLKVDPKQGQYTYVCEGSYITVSNDKLLVINSVTDWTTYENITTYHAYNTETNELTDENLLKSEVLPAMPNAIQTDSNGDIFIPSNASAYDYTSPGYVYHYTSAGEYIATYSVGVAPCGVVFVD